MFNLPSELSTVPVISRTPPLLVIVVAPLLVKVPAIFKSPASFWIAAFPLAFVNVPVILVPFAPVFQTFNVSSFVTVPAMFRVSPWFVIFNLP